MVYKFPLNVPIYNSSNDNWGTTEFGTLEEFKEFVTPLFKEPGLYEFDETAWKFNEQAQIFDSRKYYCNSAFKSKDFRTYWDAEKEKCRNGVIFIGENNTWYLTRDYYMWLNFLPIYNKEISDFGFAKVRDVQYHMALYELLAELNYKHCVILKKRQIASSYFHVAKLINSFWFERGSILKIGAAREDYINLKGSWRFFNEYRDFLHKYTAWYRPCTPDKVLNWQQRIEETTPDGKKSYRGNKSIIVGTSFEKRADAGVGGPCTYFFHEEGGIAPKADRTFFFIKPSMQSGMVTTGVFILAGSVGELDMCEPMKDMMLRPGGDFMSVTHKLMDENWAEGTTGLFIPEQWSMPPYIDKYGNSMIKESLEAIAVEREKWKKDYTPEKYQYSVSQHPINIKEAFDYRTESVFPPHLVQRQMKRLDDNEILIEYLDIYEENGKPKFKDSRRFPLNFPTDKKIEDKRGCIIVHERPPDNPDWGIYYGSIDPVGEGKTTTSESLFCLQIYKMPTEDVTIGKDGAKSSIKGDKLVASWTGRYDDINDTHDLARMLIEMYNCWTLVEANVSLFINYMIMKKKQKYLVPKDQVLFLKELEGNKMSYQAYGWKNTGGMFHNHLISYAVEYTKEIIDQELLPDGTAVKTHYGIERVTDRTLLEEMLQYREGLNVDRLVTFAALIAFRNLQLASRGYKKTITYEENFKKSQDLYKLSRNPFSNIGGLSKGSPFKNMR